MAVIIKESYDLENLKHQINFKEIFQYIEKLEISKIKAELPKSKSISRYAAIRNLKDAYKKQKLVLVLGAGVSIEFGIPSWNELLQNLMVHTIEKEPEVSSVLSKLFNEIFTPNPLKAARYLQNYFENNDALFESMVRDVMYSSVNKEKQSELLSEIVRMCVAPGKSPNLDSIITYNFDDILEYKLKETGIEIPFQSIFGIGMEIKDSEFPIYHVHGYLPETTKLTDSNKITFGENNYHQQYSDIYSWNNIVQINKFRENTCLFVGSSLIDPNIRRLLDIALKQKGNKKKYHYIFKKRIEIEFLKKELEKKLTEENLDNKNNAGLSFKETLGLIKGFYERFEEYDSASLGVQTIWVDNYDEIPLILRKMRENLV